MRRIDRHDRETFIDSLLKQVPTATRAHALRLLRWGATYGRLAEAQCNGDWPADNGERETLVCAHHESAWVREAFTRKRGYQAKCYRCEWRSTEFSLRSSAMNAQNDHAEHPGSTSVVVNGECPDCRAERIIRETCESMGPRNIAPPHVERPTDRKYVDQWCVPDFQGDPRGLTVRLQIAGTPLDAYERPALGVPTS